MLESIERLQRGRKVTDAVLGKMTELLQKGAIEPGERLPTEKELAEAFGVGRSSIREALQVLEHVGFVETRHGVGRFVSEDAEVLNEGLNWVCDLRFASAMNLLEAREAVEVACVRLAAERASADDIQQLSEMLDHMQETDCMDEAFEVETDFHLRLARSCGNPVMSDLVKMLFEMLTVQVQDFAETMPYTLQPIVEAFGQILDALRTGNAQQAEQAMKVHFTVTKESFEEMERQQAVDASREAQ